MSQFEILSKDGAVDKSLRSFKKR